LGIAQARDFRYMAPPAWMPRLSAPAEEALMRTYCSVAVALPLAFASLTAVAAAPTPEDAVRRYLKAEADFDVPALKDVLHAHFVEVSPLGQPDEHDEVLSFYAPDKKVPTPPIKIGDIKTRMAGNVAVMTTDLTMEVPGRTMRLSAGLTAVHEANGWTLLSAQYTPVREKAPASGK
jgi:hypothetical protein